MQFSVFPFAPSSFYFFLYCQSLLHFGLGSILPFIGIAITKCRYQPSFRIDKSQHVCFRVVSCESKLPPPIFFYCLKRKLELRRESLVAIACISYCWGIFVVYCSLAAMMQISQQGLLLSHLQMTKACLILWVQRLHDRRCTFPCFIHLVDLVFFLYFCNLTVGSCDGMGLGQKLASFCLSDQFSRLCGNRISVRYYSALHLQYKWDHQPSWFSQLKTFAWEAGLQALKLGGLGQNRIIGFPSLKATVESV